MNVALVSTDRTSYDVRFWLWWVAMTTLGWFVGWWVGFALGFLLGNATLVVAASAAAGLMQWWVLSVTYPTLVHRWRWWALASVAGIAASLVPYILIWGDPTFDMRWLPAITLGGALVGALQQRILRRVCARSWWWVPACTAGWALGMAWLFVLDQVLPDMTLVIPGFFVSSALAGLLLALITGSVLVWLLRQPAQPAAPPAIPRPSHVPRGVRFWFWWVAMTALGWLVGWWVGFVLGFLRSPGTTQLVCYSAGVGLMQWMLLSLTHASPAHRWRWWVPASIAGMAVPLVAYTLIWGDFPVDRPVGLQGLLAIALGGALVGVLQQRILRRVSARSWWWVPACMVGWVLAVLPPASILQTYGPLNFGLIQGLILALITGSVLVWLLRQPAAAGAAQPAAAPRHIWWRIVLAATLIAGLTYLLMRLPLFQYERGVEGGLGVTFSPDGTLLATTSSDQGGSLFDIATGRERLALPSASRMTDVAFSPDGTTLATADDTAVRLRQAASGAEVRTFPGPGASRVVFSPDGTLLVAVSNDGTVQLLEVATGTVVRAFSGQMPFRDNIAVSPDGTLLAATVVDGTVKLLEVSTGVERRTLEWQEGPDSYRAVAFSPDGSLLATGSLNGTVRLWEVATGAELRTLKGHRNWVTRAAFSPDGRLLATASDDRTVRLWDVATGAPLHTLKGHAWKVRGVAFSPDGATLASAAFDGTVKLWDVATGTEVRSIAWPETP